jgi:O-antigen ligase
MLLKGLFAAAVLTIGLTEYRPFLGGAGNLSDVLFLAVFSVGSAMPLCRLDWPRLRGLLRALRELEPLIWGGIVITLGAAIASAASASPSASWNTTLKYFVMFCVWLPWAAWAVRRYLSVFQAHVLYVLALSSVVLFTLSDVVIGTRFGTWLVSTPFQGAPENLAELRYGGPVGHPTTLGYVSAIAFILCLSAVARSGWRRAWAPFLGALMCGGGLLTSGSRAAILGVAAALVIIFWLSGRDKRRRLVLVTLVCGSALWIATNAIGLGQSPANPLQRLTESIRPRRSFEADWDRIRDLRAAGRLLSLDPVTGYGMENVGTSPLKTVGFNLHNTVLQSWLAGGVLTAVGTLWLYGVTLWAGWRGVRDARPMALGLLAACVAFILIDMAHPHLYMRFKWFVVALLFTTVHDNPQSAERPDASPV